MKRNLPYYAAAATNILLLACGIVNIMSLILGLMMIPLTNILRKEA